jgi:hypothetical protein
MGAGDGHAVTLRNLRRRLVSTGFDARLLVLVDSLLWHADQ